MAPVKPALATKTLTHDCSIFSRNRATEKLVPGDSSQIGFATSRHTDEPWLGAHAFF
jgi:hypothetical protein